MARCQEFAEVGKHAHKLKIVGALLIIASGFAGFLCPRLGPAGVDFVPYHIEQPEQPELPTKTTTTETTTTETTAITTTATTTKTTTTSPKLYCRLLAECYNACYLRKAVGPCKAESCCPSSAAYYYDDAFMGFYVCNGTANSCMTACTREQIWFCNEDATLRAPNLHVEGQSHCNKVTFMRIQKTGSTSVGEVLLPTMCGFHGQQCGKEDGYTHLDFNGAIALANKGVPVGSGCVFTILRDVVERTLSEFFFLRENRWALWQDQWDVPDAEAGKLDDIIVQSNISKAFQEYLYSEENPARNRQTLYLLGFERRFISGDRLRHVSTDFSNGLPAKAYNWSNHKELLACAKARLMELTVFGLTECLRLSVEVMAPRLGWDARMAISLMDHAHSRIQDKSQHQVALLQLRPTQEFATKHVVPPRRRLSGWRSIIDPVLVEEIKAVNSLDVELVEFARTAFRDLYKHNCSEPA